MQTLTQRRILLGITGGIAAYKSADLVRRLKEWGADVQVVMTPAATQFVTPLTYQALSGRVVRLDLLDANAEAGMGHIELARWAELVLIAPASANFIARLAHGLANDLLSALCLASDRPLAIAPAMNQQMWLNPATQANCQTLRQRGVWQWGPGSGEQACGEVGEGRMLEPLQLRELIVDFFTQACPLAGLRVLISAGPTREAIDPVRFISNRSSGQMGFAIATAAAAAGAQVCMVSGPVPLATPAGVERIDVESALQMYEAVLQRAAHTDIFIATAAVADYRAATASPQKIKKTQETFTLALERNPDILATVAALENRPFTVGFAAETERVLEYADDKRRRKNLDMIAANQVGAPDRGFESSNNALHVLWEGGEQALPLADKITLGRQLVALIAQRYRARQY
ncbi:MAG: bifunctional phosphopantothenoylcysteine decarboxylase/phosphopantothenate--cysteine ligase CoaBC [Gammaproteobacteria bacterium]|nr:bifunctional phosphopantothenoylcysteine decarboxylase/phosphopantothenate--cysteine ligase CoaBC [Gammaproteobacteria bacterium]MCP5458492.1 bifunctional phosphopantothenoylcysteine decarboxylase/phosphopantothenate--cysteine ligase CoaBC [Gammaproteobacteria bacterium]